MQLPDNRTRTVFPIAITAGIVLLCLLQLPLHAQAQTKVDGRGERGDFHLQLQIYGVQPTSAMEDRGLGMPESGLGVGLQTQLRIADLPLAWTLSAAWLQAEMPAPQSGLRFTQTGAHFRGQFTTSKPWRMLPVMTGIQGTLPYSRAVEFYGSVAAGLAWLDAPDYAYREINAETSAQWESFTAAAWSVGAGIIIHDMFTLGIGYLDCGSHELRGKVAQGGDEAQAASAQQSISTFLLSVGYHL